MKETTSDMSYPWRAVEEKLNSLTPVSGGFSLAKRGLVNLPGGEIAFVKIGTEENSKKWAEKELAVYEYLKRVSYPFVPRLLSEATDKTAFALQALLPEEGWDWSETWTVERVDATLEATDRLAQFNPVSESWASPDEQSLDARSDGWQQLNGAPELQEKLVAKLKKAGHETVSENLDFRQAAERSSQFTFRADTLVHYDVRADNSAWNASKNEVKLVDWNWAQMGDARIDQTATLVNVQRGGLDISSSHANRLDAEALHWLAGFWLRGAATPIWQGGSESLRDFQLEAGVTSLALLARLEA